MDKEKGTVSTNVSIDKYDEKMVLIDRYNSEDENQINKKEVN